MSMKIVKLRTHWHPGDAELMINFLDDIRDLLCEVYGDEIVEMHQKDGDKGQGDDQQTDLPFDDEIDF